MADIPKTAIRAYPSRYVAKWTMKDGTAIAIRPIRPEDEPSMVKFHETLSARSVYLRYFHLMNLEQRVTHERLTRICFIDYDREMALVAERRNPETGEPEILAVGRMTKVHGTNEGEVAVLVSDHWQGRGLGKELLSRLMAVGADDVLSAVAETARNYPSHIILEEPCARTERSLRTALTAPECLYHLAICNFVHRQHFERFAALPGNNKSFRNILSYFSN